ncbi:MAG: ankyrin repeat domain-containing protein [Candidatus Babeliaceae bacterium]|jgi:hypothetical protein
MNFLKQKVITLCLIIFLCSFLTVLSYPYRFQRLMLLDKNTQDIKKCVDIIYDIHIMAPDFAKKPSRKNVREGLLKLDERHALSTPERILLAVLRTLNKQADEKIDLLWELVQNAEFYPATQLDFMSYGGKVFPKEFKNSNNITFINSDTYRAKFNAITSIANNGPQYSSAKIVDIKSGLDNFFNIDLSCEKHTIRQFCDLFKITDKDNFTLAKKDWLSFKELYEKEAKPIFNDILKHKAHATTTDLIEHLEHLPPIQESLLRQQLASVINQITDFELLINILSSSSKNHAVIYAGGAHCKRIWQWLQNVYGYDLITDLGSEINYTNAIISHKAWAYLLEKPIQSLNRYKQWGNRPFINIVTEGSEIWNNFAQFFNIFIHRSDAEMLEQLQQFFKKADKTFVNFMETRLYTQNNQTLLFTTVNQGLMQSTEFLIKHGARTNVPDNKGQTPLFYAGPYPDIVKLLLAHGANASAKNNNNQSVMRYLYNQKNTDPESKVLIAQNQLSFKWLTRAKKYLSKLFGWSKPKNAPSKLETALIQLDSHLNLLQKSLR